MADLSFTAADIRAMRNHGAVVLPFTAGGTITVGHVVYIASDGDVERADANAAGQQQVIGVAVESKDGETTISAGEPCSVCVFGPVEGFSGMTPNTTGWLSDTVGRIADAAATFDRIVGYAQSATCFFVNPVRSEEASA